MVMVEMMETLVEDTGRTLEALMPEDMLTRRKR